MVCGRTSRDAQIRKTYNMISLKRIIEQQDSMGQYYDLGKDFAAFRRMIDGADQQLRQEYEKIISKKLVGKRVRARASRGYKQYVKDYEFDVTKISIDDYYDNFVVVAYDNTTPKPKEYFLKPGFKVTILGPATGEPSPQKGGKPEDNQTPKAEQPTTPGATPQAAPDAAQHQPMAQAPAGNTPSERPLEEDDDTAGTGHYDAYPIDQIGKDIEPWLPKILKKPGSMAMRDFIKGLGWLKDHGHGKTVAMFDLKIPVDSINVNLTPDIMRQILQKVNKQGTIGVTFDLLKMEMDERRGTWDIRLKKTMTDTTRV